MWDKGNLTTREAKEAIKEVANEETADFEHLEVLWDEICAQELADASKVH